MSNNNVSFKTEFGFIMVGAIIFIASFLWKDFLSDLEDKYFPKQNGLLIRFFYIVIVTVILVLVATYLRNLLGLKFTAHNLQLSDEPIDEGSDNMEGFSNPTKNLNQNLYKNGWYSHPVT